MAEFWFNIGACGGGGAGGGRKKGLTYTISVPEKTTTTKKKSCNGYLSLQLIVMESNPC